MKFFILDELNLLYISSLNSNLLIILIGNINIFAMKHKNARKIPLKINIFPHIPSNTGIVILGITWWNTVKVQYFFKLYVQDPG
jgi:hypothetical protein